MAMEAEPFRSFSKSGCKTDRFARPCVADSAQIMARASTFRHKAINGADIIKPKPNQTINGSPFGAGQSGLSHFSASAYSGCAKINMPEINSTDNVTWMNRGAVSLQT